MTIVHDKLTEDFPTPVKRTDSLHLRAPALVICPPEKDGFPQQSSGDHRVCLHPHQCLFACHAEAPPDSSPNCLHTRSPTQLGTAHSCLVPIHHHFTLCLSASLICSMLTATKRSGRCGIHCVDSIRFPCRDIDPLDFFVLSNSPRQSVHISTCGPWALWAPPTSSICTHSFSRLGVWLIARRPTHSMGPTTAREPKR